MLLIPTCLPSGVQVTIVKVIDVAFMADAHMSTLLIVSMWVIRVG
jgi:hypothetical protein